jgi:hypothetical protein
MEVFMKKMFFFWIFLSFSNIFVYSQNLPDSIISVRVDWENFYQKHFDLKVSFKDVKIPKSSPGFSRLIFIPEGLKIKQAAAVLKKYFKLGVIGDSLINERENKKSYALLVKDNIESDENLRGLSAKGLADKKINTLNLLERLLFELKYFDETGKHLDSANLTLCGSTKNEFNKVPAIGWDSEGYLSIFWFGERYSGSEVRGREIIL